MVNFEKMWKFHNISRAGTFGIFYEKFKLLRMDSNFSCMFKMMMPKNFVWYCRNFSSKILTSPNELIFHTHVSDDDSNKFNKFGDIK